ncbi:MAG: 2-keto-4-pentenoate hydratase [Xylophilus ampelinus]
MPRTDAGSAASATPYSPTALAGRLAALRRTGGVLSAPEAALLPPDDASAWAVQAETLRLCGGGIAAWKVGAKGDGPAAAAPLPAAGVLPSPATLPRADTGPLSGLELEIAFRFGRGFAPIGRDWTADEVMAGVESVCATIELVASRLPGGSRAHPPQAALADLLSHGALAVGEAAPYDAAYPFGAPAAVAFDFDGADAIAAPPGNPAGDPRRLLPWLVNHCLARGMPFDAGTLVTTGTYTGLYLPPGPGTATGRIAGLPPVVLTLA